MRSAVNLFSKSIKNRILTGFFTLTVIIILLSSTSFHYLNKTENIRQVNKQISILQVMSLNMIQKDNDFFELETINPSYFENHQSIILTQRDSINTRIVKTLAQLDTSINAYDFPVLEYLKQIDSTLGQYNLIFEQTETKVYQRGFKDFGLIGKMREFAHELEENAGVNKIVLSDVLLLRRHEKDFLIRNEPQYITKLNSLADRLINEQNSKQNASGNKLATVVSNYRDAFNYMVEVQHQIGLNSNAGLRNDLDGLVKLLDKQFSELASVSDQYSNRLINEGTIIYAFTVFSSIILSIFLSYFIATKLSNPIRKLSNLIDRVMRERNPHLVDTSNNKSANEIYKLTGSFVKLMNQTNHQLSEIQDKSKQLRSQNDELKKLNEELDSFIYSVAHDLRSPLTSMLGLLKIAKLENSQDTLNIHFDHMDRSIRKMEKFIKDVVGYAKNKKLEITPEKVDLAEMVNGIFEDNQFIEGFDRIHKEVNLKADTDFYSDKNRLAIIFNNLISNAIRYSDLDKEQPFIHVEITVTEISAVVRFIDNGIGIDQENIEKVFQMFYRATEKSSGSGLGLFILKETIEKLNGSVNVESSSGNGTEFIIIIPNAAYSEGQAKAQTPALTA